MRDITVFSKMYYLHHNGTYYSRIHIIRLNISAEIARKIMALVVESKWRWLVSLWVGSLDLSIYSALASFFGVPVKSV